MSETGDVTNLVRLLAALLTSRKLTLSSCESLTGGLFGATVCAVPGASDYYRGGVITYVDAVKEAVGVAPATLAKFTAISGECAREMALAAAKLTGSDVAVSFTGNAGPTAQDGKPVGEVWIGVAFKGQVRAVRYLFAGGRNAIRAACVASGLRLLLAALAE